MRFFSIAFAISVLSTLSSQSSYAQSQVSLPSESALAGWDKKFAVGRYAVEEFQVDAQGNPLPSTVKTREYCFSQTEMRMLSRSPALPGMNRSCTPLKVSLSGDSFDAVFACDSEDQGQPKEMVQSVLAVTSPSTIESITVRLAIHAGKEPTLLFGTGSKLKRLSACTK
jgi:hypothetical protein